MTDHARAGVFSITEPLPGPGETVLLEASAGTGKTWTIAALAARYIAEGRARIDELLVVTFTRAASLELRSRVRGRLVEVEAALAGATSYSHGDDELLDLLLADEGARKERRGNVRAALAAFDSAVIVTIHQFCQTVLRGLGVAGDTDPAARLVEDLDDLLVEVVDDLYLRDYARSDLAAEFDRRTAFAVAAAAVQDPGARLEPADADPETPAGRRYEFATAVRRELDLRKRRMGVLSFDDLLSQLSEALASEDAPARRRMRERWPVVLIDEFQDTDPVQWQVFERAFTGHSTLVLIGDPKQAIYAFRGGDVYAYLRAKATAGVHRTLAVNRRSDRPLLDSIQALLGGAELGGPEIVVGDVTAHHRQSRLAGLPDPTPFRLRLVEAGRASGGFATVATVNPIIAADVAADIKQALRAEARFDGRPLRPEDIAVIAHARRHLGIVQQALADVGVPAVIAGGGSVFASAGAREWITLLEALEQPHRRGRVRAAALGALFGHRADDLAADDLIADGSVTDRVADTLRDWVDLLAARGVAAVYEASVVECDLFARTLGRIGGERELTDLQHLAQVLHAESSRSGTRGATALLAWLREQMSDDVEQAGGDRTRRLDSDARAVQLVTIHGSKGLEFPIVYLPFAADRFLARSRTTARFHDAAGNRVLDIGKPGAQFEAHDTLALGEDAAESLRAFYVAITRAQSQVVAWWAPTRNATASPLHRMLFGRKPGAGAVPDTAAMVADRVAWQGCRALAERGGPQPQHAIPAEIDREPLPAAVAPLAVRHFERTIDDDWRRTSYTALADAPAAGRAAPALVSSEPEVAPKADEPEPAQGPAGTVVAVPDAALATPSPLADFEASAQFGSLVHAVLEHADATAPDLGTELRGHIGRQLVRWPVALDPDALAAGLATVLTSPLGPLADEITLRDLGPADRLCELDFELPLGGGDRPSPECVAGRLGDVAGLLRRHLPSGDPVRAWADALDDPALGGQVLAGYLTGSVDVVLRVGERYLVADYKTNRLGAFDVPLTAADYAPAALDAAMGHSSYPLQALLYAVVAHRFLRWRLRDYDPDRHLGGVLYLYLRGMCGPGTPRVDGAPCGVFAWRPPSALVIELSDLLDGNPGRDAGRDSGDKGARA